MLLPEPRLEMVRHVENAIVTRAIKRPKGQAHSGAVYDTEGDLIRDTPRHLDRPETWADPLRFDGRKVERRLPGAIYLYHAFRHFGHLLIETLPALCWVDQFEPDVPLLFHPFARRGLNVFTDTAHGSACRELLGIAAERIVMADVDIAVDELLLPPRPYTLPDGAYYDFRSVYRTMRQAALAQAPAATARRVYLSRSGLTGDPRGPRISNEAAVESRLAELGFVIVHPEQLPLPEQIRTVAEAEIVVGVDGSALHLAAFMPRGSRMLILQTKRRKQIERLNEMMGVRTNVLPAIPSPDGSRSPGPVIDIAQLERELR